MSTLPPRKRPLIKRSLDFRLPSPCDLRPPLPRARATMDPSDPLHACISDDAGAPPDAGAPVAPATADPSPGTRRTPARAAARPAGRADSNAPLASLFATPGFAFGRTPPAVAAAPLDPGGAPEDRKSVV